MIKVLPTKGMFTNKTGTQHIAEVPVFIMVPAVNIEPTTAYRKGKTILCFKDGKFWNFSL